MLNNARAVRTADGGVDLVSNQRDGKEFERALALKIRQVPQSVKSVSREESSTDRMETSIRTDPIVQTSPRTTLNATPSKFCPSLTHHFLTRGWGW